MINLIINELEYARNLVSGTVTEQNVYYALSLLSRYYYHVEGYRKKKIMLLLQEYMSRHYIVDNFEIHEWNERIEKIASSAQKYPLKEIRGISISTTEMQVIDSITGSALRRLAFTILCLAKLGNLRNPKNNGWVNAKTKDVFALANITCSSFEQQVKIGLLYHRGLLEFPKQNDNLSYRVTFIDNSTNEAMFIQDLRALGYQYMNYHDGGFVRCGECGILMKDNQGNAGRKRLYCKNCAAPKPMEKKLIQCVDCGIMFSVNSKNNKTQRCPYCSREHNREYHKQYMRNRRKLDRVLI